MAQEACLPVHFSKILINEIRIVICAFIFIRIPCQFPDCNAIVCILNMFGQVPYSRLNLGRGFWRRGVCLWGRQTRCCCRWIRWRLSSILLSHSLDAKLASRAITCRLTSRASLRVRVAPREILVPMPLSLDSCWFSLTIPTNMSRETARETAVFCWDKAIVRSIIDPTMVISSLLGCIKVHRFTLSSEDHSSSILSIGR